MPPVPGATPRPELKPSDSRKASKSSALTVPTLQKLSEKLPYSANLPNYYEFLANNLHICANYLQSYVKLIKTTYLCYQMKKNDTYLKNEMKKATDKDEHRRRPKKINYLKKEHKKSKKTYIYKPSNLQNQFTPFNYNYLQNQFKLFTHLFTKFYIYLQFITFTIQSIIFTNIYTMTIKFQMKTRKNIRDRRTKSIPETQCLFKMYLRPKEEELMETQEKYFNLKPDAHSYKILKMSQITYMPYTYDNGKIYLLNKHLTLI